MHNSVYRYYKVSINILFFSYYNDSKIYRLPNKSTAYLIGLLYACLTLLLGFLSFDILNKFRGIKNSMKALDINLSGGVDYTKNATEGNFDDKIKYIYYNVLPSTREELSIEEIDFVVDLRNMFAGSEETSMISFVNEGLNHLYQKTIDEDVLNDIIEAIEMYDADESVTN